MKGIADIQDERLNEIMYRFYKKEDQNQFFSDDPMLQ